MKSLNLPYLNAESHRMADLSSWSRDCSCPSSYITRLLEQQTSEGAWKNKWGQERGMLPHHVTRGSKCAASIDTHTNTNTHTLTQSLPWIWHEGRCI